MPHSPLSGTSKFCPQGRVSACHKAPLPNDAKSTVAPRRKPYQRTGVTNERGKLAMRPSVLLATLSRAILCALQQSVTWATID